MRPRNEFLEVPFSLAKMLPLAAALAASSVSMSAVHALEVKPVESFDVTRYLGTWREIASIPQFFRRHCVRDTKASYSAAADSLIRVDTVCTRDDGTRERASGRARPADPNVAAKLELTFLELLGEYRFWVAADYWVIALDPNYSWAVVGHPSRRYGWILSRECKAQPSESRMFQ